MANTLILNKWGGITCLAIEYTVDWSEPPILLMKISQIAHEFFTFFSYPISALEAFAKLLKSKKFEDYTNFLKSVLAFRDMLQLQWNRVFAIKAISGLVLLSLNTILMVEKWGYLANLSSKSSYHNTFLLSRLGIGTSLLWNAWEKIPILNLQEAKNFNKFTHYSELCKNSSIIDWRLFFQMEIGRLSNKRNSLPLNDPKIVKIDHRITFLNDRTTKLNSDENPLRLFEKFLDNEEKRYSAKLQKTQTKKIVNYSLFLKIPLSFCLLFCNKKSLLSPFWRLLLTIFDISLSVFHFYMRKIKKIAL